jgi:hypothetical protein
VTNQASKLGSSGQRCGGAQASETRAMAAAGDKGRARRLGQDLYRARNTRVLGTHAEAEGRRRRWP